MAGRTGRCYGSGRRVTRSQLMEKHDGPHKSASHLIQRDGINFDGPVAKKGFSSRLVTLQKLHPCEEVLHLNIHSTRVRNVPAYFHQDLPLCQGDSSFPFHPELQTIFTLTSPFPFKHRVLVEYVTFHGAQYVDTFDLARAWHTREYQKGGVRQPEEKGCCMIHGLADSSSY
ncbi:hypothetical protein CDAR_311701 [Caerostris darwini]|uniref:Uncharacterized protein n=1 Tax=Caerostris darwini TaxID=1538125 RepID=A0AAV4TM66_9ARAC|nr:hypothetical protein CDAR_311701 [Caerostris darwini]